MGDYSIPSRRASIARVLSHAAFRALLAILQLREDEAAKPIDLGGGPFAVRDALGRVELGPARRGDRVGEADGAKRRVPEARLPWGLLVELLTALLHLKLGKEK